MTRLAQDNSFSAITNNLDQVYSLRVGMIRLIAIAYFFCFHSGSDPVMPVQPSHGPGGSEYAFKEIVMEDHAKKPDGYWLFYPEKMKTRVSKVVVFIHGYGTYNPMIYGGWIKHLVRKGNIVIYPRYQRNLIAPKPKKFARNAALGINDALDYLVAEKKIQSRDVHYSYVGHSYGGVISSALANDPDFYDLKKPNALFLVSPGTGPLKGGRLESYDKIDPDTKMLVMISAQDEVVGRSFADLVYSTSKQVKIRNFITQYPDEYQGLRITAHHNECYSIDFDFDSGVRNLSAKRALRVATLDVLDYRGYWKLFDGLIACSTEGEYCNFAFGGEEPQTSLGEWEAGRPLRALKVISKK